MSAKRIVVFGGNGYVGRNVCRHAVRQGTHVVSVNRSGNPFEERRQPDWAQKVEWRVGDAADASTYRELLHRADGVVTCIGAFGTNEVVIICLRLVRCK